MLLQKILDQEQVSKPRRAEKPAAAGGKRLTPKGPPRFAALD